MKNISELEEELSGLIEERRKLVSAKLDFKDFFKKIFVYTCIASIIFSIVICFTTEIDAGVLDRDTVPFFFPFLFSIVFAYVWHNVIYLENKGIGIACVVYLYFLLVLILLFQPIESSSLPIWIVQIGVSMSFLQPLYALLFAVMIFIGPHLNLAHKLSKIDDRVSILEVEKARREREKEEAELEYVKAKKQVEEQEEIIQKLKEK